MQFFERKLAGGMALEDSVRRAVNRVRYAGPARDARPGRWSCTSPPPTSASSSCSGRSSRRSPRRASRSSGCRRPGPYVAALEARGIRTSRSGTRRGRSRPVEDARALGELVVGVPPAPARRSCTPTTRSPASTDGSRRGSRGCRSSSTRCTACTRSRRIRSPGARPSTASNGSPSCARTPSSCRTPKTSRRSPASACRGASSRCSATASTSRASIASRSPTPTCAAARAELGACGPDDVVVGLVGRLVREKGYREVFEAARELRDARCRTFGSR